MSDNIRRLEERLAEATDPIEKLDASIDLAEALRRVDPARGRAVASKALASARRRKETGRATRLTTILGFCEYFATNHEAAVERFAQAIELAGLNGDEPNRARADYGMGIARLAMRESAPAMAALVSSLELVDRHDMKELRGHVHNGIGMVLNTVSDFIGSLEAYRLSLDAFRAVEDVGGEAIVLNNMGSSYMALGELGLAFEAFVQSNEICRARDDRQTRMHVLINIGHALHRQKKPDQAIPYFVDALELARSLDNERLQATALSNLASIHISDPEGDLAEAEKYCRQAIEIAERINDTSIWFHTTRLGEIHHGREEYDRALDCYTRALEGSRSIGDRFLEQQILSRLADLHETIGETAEALRYHKLHVDLREEVVGRQRQHEMMQFQIRLELERAEKERAILRLENESLERENAHNLSELTSSALHIVEKNEFLDSLKRELSDVVRAVDESVRPALRSLLQQVNSRIDGADGWGAFEERFELIQHDFVHRLSTSCPSLSATELKVCALLRLTLNTKEIASILSISTKTVEVHRYNIRRKLALPPEASLATYMASF